MRVVLKQISLVLITTFGLISCAFKVNHKHDIGPRLKNSLAKLEKGTQSAAEGVNLIGSTVREQFTSKSAEQNLNQTENFDFNALGQPIQSRPIILTLDSQDNIVFENTQTGEQYLFDPNELTVSLSPTESGEMFEDLSTDTLIDWWFITNQDQIINIVLDASNQNQIEGFLDIYNP